MSALIDSPVHATAARVRAPAETAFDYLADPERLCHWALTTQNVSGIDATTVKAASRLDGSVTLVRVQADTKRLSIDYLIGATLSTLVPRIMARVVRGPELADEDGCCTITLVAWRAADMDDERWRRLVAAHEWEVLLLQSLIETGQREDEPA